MFLMKHSVIFKGPDFLSIDKTGPQARKAMFVVDLVWVNLTNQESFSAMLTNQSVTFTAPGQAQPLLNKGLK